MAHEDLRPSWGVATNRHANEIKLRPSLWLSSEPNRECQERAQSRAPNPAASQSPDQIAGHAGSTNDLSCLRFASAE